MVGIRHGPLAFGTPNHQKRHFDRATYGTGKRLREQNSGDILVFFLILIWVAILAIARNTFHHLVVSPYNGTGLTLL